MDALPRILYIVGRNSLLSQTIELTIHNLLGKSFVSTSVVQLFGEVATPPDSVTAVLVDNGDEAARTALFERLENEAEGDLPTFTAALFNVEPEDERISSTIAIGVRGLFFSTDPISRLLEGLEHFLTENMWIPKEILLRAAVRRRHHQNSTEASRLTMREMQILAHVCTGATNDQIGSVLCISRHTVKTHMYNLFPKIGVKNRLHAALWAAENLRPQIRFLSAPAAARAVTQV